jgi:hypothetical protein
MTADENPETDVAPALLPVRMLNEYAYCPRLFHCRTPTSRHLKTPRRRGTSPPRSAVRCGSALSGWA